MEKAKHLATRHNDAPPKNSSEVAPKHFATKSDNSDVVAQPDRLFGDGLYDVQHVDMDNNKDPLNVARIRTAVGDLGLRSIDVVAAYVLTKDESDSIAGQRATSDDNQRAESVPAGREGDDDSYERQRSRIDSTVAEWKTLRSGVEAARSRGDARALADASVALRDYEQANREVLEKSTDYSGEWDVSRDFNQLRHLRAKKLAEREILSEKLEDSKNAGDYEDVAAAYVALRDYKEAQREFLAHAPDDQKYRTMGHKDDPITHRAKHFREDAKHQAPSRAELRRADQEAGYSRLKSYRKAKRGLRWLKKYHAGDISLTPGNEAKARTLEATIDRLGMEYGKSLPENLSLDERSRKIKQFQERWWTGKTYEDEIDIPGKFVERIKHDDKGRAFKEVVPATKKYSIPEPASRTLESGQYGKHEKRFATIDANPVERAAQAMEYARESLLNSPGIKRVAATAALIAVAVAGSVFGNVAKAKAAKAAGDSVKDRSALGVVYDRPASDSKIDLGDGMEADLDTVEELDVVAENGELRTDYNAETMPEADYRMFGEKLEDGSWDTSDKLTRTSFASIDDLTDDSAETWRTHMARSAATNPEVQAIYCQNLLGSDQLQQLGFNGNVNEFADMLGDNDELRATAQNMLDEALNDSTFERIQLSGLYNNTGISVEDYSDEHDLMFGEISLNGDYAWSVVNRATGKVLIVKEACGGNVVILIVDQVAVEKSGLIHGEIEPTPDRDPDSNETYEEQDDDDSDTTPDQDPGDDESHEEEEPGPSDKDDDDKPGTEEEGHPKNEYDNDIQQEAAHGFEDKAHASDEEQQYDSDEADAVPQASDAIGNIPGVQSDRPEEKKSADQSLTDNSRDVSAGSSVEQQAAADQAAEAERQRQIELAQQQAAAEAEAQAQAQAQAQAEAQAQAQAEAEAQQRAADQAAEAERQRQIELAQQQAAAEAEAQAQAEAEAQQQAVEAESQTNQDNMG